MAEEDLERWQGKCTNLVTSEKESPWKEGGTEILEFVREMGRRLSGDSKQRETQVQRRLPSGPQARKVQA